MGRQVALLSSAERDLEGIHEYTLDEWGPRQARRYLQGLRRKLKLLAENPKLAPAYRRGATVRVALYEKHRILYRETPEGIEVGRVLHQAQQMGRALERYEALRAQVERYLGEGDPKS